MVLNADLLKQFFEASSLEEISEDRMNSLIEQYPYFVHLHWLSALKRWDLSHDKNDLQSAGAFTFNPLRLQQYCSETGDQILYDTPKPFFESENHAAEPSTQDGNNSTDHQLIEEEQIEKPEESVQAVENKAEDKHEAVSGDTYSEPVVQPLFTQDYFAYTGAKLPEQIENDKKPTMDQLRSFTGWLRTMKRSVVYSADPDLGEEKTNTNSNEGQPLDQEVMTETMAEVRASMGQNDKAIAIYEKLSLSNPEKSAYFAQKIEALKNK